MATVGARVVINDTPAFFEPEFDSDSIFEFHRKLPGYAKTPLVGAPHLAAQLGVGSVWVKDESHRLGLPAYKILGASWACYRRLEQRLGNFQGWNSIAELAEQLKSRESVQLVAATEGNHGRAVARVARWLGIQAHIFLPNTAAPSRARLIEQEGAQVTVVNGSYDDAVRAAAALNDDDQLVISDTAWPGYEQIPQWVIDGYSTLFREVDLQLAAAGARPIDVAAVQMGVGALATAVVTHYRARSSSAQVIGVEPEKASCILTSVVAGKLTEVSGPYDPLMGGLNCGYPSPLAWPVISKGLSAYLALPTARALEAVLALKKEGVTSSPSGATGLGGIFELLLGPDSANFRAMLRLTRTSTLFVISTEGALN